MGEERGRINILLTGVGGKNHDGGTLADTIMLFSLDPNTKQAAMVSVPRDLTVPIEGYGYRKINSVNAFAEKELPGSGAKVFSESFAKTFGQPIDYYLRIDFSSFSRFIDDIGGIEVIVENTLDDYAYPILGQEDNPSYYSRYEHLHVDKGLVHMSGSLALKFARSRHGINGEGSDFARARRQQLIMEAVKTKLKETNFLLKPSIITKTITNYRENVSTNLEPWSILRLWSLFKDTQKEQIVNKVLDDGPDGMLRSDRGLDGAYILVPRTGDFTEISDMMAGLFAVTTPALKNQIKTENPTVIVKNGTTIAGLASKIGTGLTTSGFTLVDTSNADKKTYASSIIYDLSTTSKPNSLELLKQKIGGSISTDIPTWLIKEIESDGSYIAGFVKPDYVVILGADINLNKSSSVNN